MSVAIPISLMFIVICSIAAIGTPVLREFTILGAVAAATVLLCHLEAWSCQERPVRTEDEPD